jgi:hypothetical protein
MSTLTKPYTAQAGAGTTKLQAIRLKYNRLMKELDFSYFAFISFVIAFSACLGGSLVKFSLQYNSAYWQFALGMCLSLVNIVACVAQFPVKWVFNIFVLTTLANIALILISVFL